MKINKINKKIPANKKLAHEGNMRNKFYEFYYYEKGRAYRGMFSGNADLEPCSEKISRLFKRGLNLIKKFIK